MARISSTAAGTGGTRRRAAGRKRASVEKGLPGMAEAVGAAELEDRSDRASRAFTPEAPGAGVLPNGPAAAAAAAPAAVPSRLQRWLGRARALGLREPEDLVFELHVRQGLPLLVVAQALDLNLATVRALWELCQVARAARAPKSEAELTALREHLGAVLWQTVEATYPSVPLVVAEEEVDEEEPGQPTPPMLSVRLKALDQISKLYDVSLAKPAAGAGPLPYATPEEIAEDVRLRVLEMHRREDGER